MQAYEESPGADSGGREPLQPPETCPPEIWDRDLRWSSLWAEYGTFHRGWMMDPAWDKLTAKDIKVFLYILSCCSPSRKNPHRFWAIYDYQLGYALGMSRTTACRARNKLQKLGFVRCTRHDPRHKRGCWRWYLQEPKPRAETCCSG
jgi:hypothetical protein